MRSGNRARRTRTLVAILVTVLATPALSAQESSLGERLPVRRMVLENGLRLIVLPRGGAPTVSFVVRYDVGGVHEHLGTTGAAHLLEHMLFKGTTSIGTTDPEAERKLFERMDEAHDTLLTARALGDSAEVARLRAEIEALEDEARQYVVPNEFDRMLTRAGAQGLNATTTSEATVYFVELPSNQTELWFVLEADRMAHPVFREFYSERDVVTEERRMRVDTSPGGLLYEQHLAASFTMHPYGVPVVGYMSDLETLSRRDIATYFRRFYGPNNAVVTIVGDVDADQIVDWAERYMSPIARGEEPPLVLAVEPPQRGERRVEVVWDAEPALRMGWHVPSALSDEAPALAMASALLTGGRTSRLYRRLILDDRLATAVVSSLGPGDRFPQLFQIDATPRAPHGPVEVEAAIYEEIRRLTTDGPEETDLQRVRNQIEAGKVRRLQSNMGLALQLAESEALHGDWRETFRNSDKLRRVTAEDVREVLARYFTRENRTVATLHRAQEGR